MKTRSALKLALVAGLASTSIAVAQPAATDLGTLPDGLTNVPSIQIDPAAIVWYKFTITQPVTGAGTRYLDLDTEGSSISDTEIGIYDSVGTLVANDDDGGNGLMSQLTFGGTGVPRPPVGAGTAYNGRHGDLAPGTYYLAVGAFNTTFNASNWDAISTSGNSGIANLNIVSDEFVAGRCCFANGTCSVTTSGNCTSQGGTYGGDNTDCAAVCPLPPGTWAEQGEAGDMPGTANVTSGSGALTTIVGTVTGDIDMYKIQVCDFNAFSATTANNGTTIDTQLFVFDASGMGVVMNDDASETPIVRQSAVTNLGVTGNGTYYVAVGTYNNDPQDSAAQFLWTNDFYLVHQPDGPGAANPLAAWSGGGVSGGYTITLTGSCFSQGGTGPTCYANCDNSTNVPFLNVLDFNCFLNQFNQGASYANCDNSTQQPVLNVLDFNCFLNKFNTGCTAP